MSGIDLDVEMYLAPESTGIYGWVPFVPMAGQELQVERGVDELNAEPKPGQMTAWIRDPNGNLNQDNPMGLYYGSIGRGVQCRSLIRAAADTFSTPSSNSWGSSWTNGSSSGGTVSATDWSVSGGTARHSVPVAGAYRVSEYNKATQRQVDAEVRVTVTVPTSNVTGTGAMATEVWFRATDVLNYVAMSLAFQVDETLQIAFYDRTAGVNRWLLYYTTVPGFSLTTGTTFDIACQCEAGTLRAKVWKHGDPEPMDWQVTVSGAGIRPGYVAVASFVYAGNTNAAPNTFVYDDFKLRLPVFAGEIADITPHGDDKSRGARRARVVARDIIHRLQLPGAPEKSMMRRGRSSSRLWRYVGTNTATGGTVNTFVLPTANLGSTAVGDLLFFTQGGYRLEDTPFRVTGISSVAGTSTITFTPDARDAVASGVVALVIRESGTGTLPLAYWSMEDGSASTQVTPSLPGTPTMSILGGTPDFASYSDFPCSEPVLQLNDAELLATLPNYANTTNAISWLFLLGMPTTDDPATGSDLIQWYSTGTARSYDLLYQATGNGRLELRAYDSDGVQLFSSGAIEFSLRGRPCQVTVSLEETAGQVYYYMSTIGMDGTTGGVGPIAMTSVTTLGKINRVRVNPNGGYDNVAMGHLTFVPSRMETSFTLNDVVGWRGHNALRWLLRLSYEERIPFSYRTSWDVVTTNVGRQKTVKAFDAMADAAKVDGGFLTGPKGAVALEYCSRGALHELTSPVFTLHGGPNGHIDEVEPVYDTAEVYNYVIVDREDGATVVQEETSGRLSSALPPAGIGRRERKFDLLIGSDLLAERAADWLAAVGTVAVPRVSEVSALPAARNSITVEQMADLNVGLRIDIDTLTSRGIYDTLSQVVAGYKLDLSDRHNPQVTITCIPFEPYRAWAFTGDDRARLDGFDSRTTSTLTTTQLGALTVQSLSGDFLWTTSPADFPLNIKIAGEVMTVSAIADTAPGVQTFTISARSVNGVVKAHATTGRAVNLALPNRAAMR
jgi:hypothetical protein